jgi:hypothetical protein
MKSDSRLQTHTLTLVHIFHQPCKAWPIPDRPAMPLVPRASTGHACFPAGSEPASGRRPTTAAPFVSRRSSASRPTLRGREGEGDGGTPHCPTLPLLGAPGQPAPPNRAPTGSQAFRTWSPRPRASWSSSPCGEEGR